MLLEAGDVSSSWIAETAPRRTDGDRPPRRRRVAILGFSDTVKDAPVSDHTWELWALNGFHRVAKADFGLDIPEHRYGLWFDLHSARYTRAYGELAGIGEAQTEWLRKPHPFRVFMLEADPAFPASVRYPLEEVVEKLGREYFTSSIAYAMAYALTLPDLGELGLWGVDLVHDSEYADQRPCAEYWAGRAESLGVRVTVHERSAIMRQRFRYGYEAENPLLLELGTMLQTQAGVLDKRLAELHGAQEKTVAEMQTNDGALQLVRTLLSRLEVYRRGGRL